MRFLPVALAASLAAALPASAQTRPANADTYEAIIQHGQVLVLGDVEIDVAFNPDGTFTAMGGASSGVWKIVDDKLCTTPKETMTESCAAYPAGKKSGETFTLISPDGPVTIRIL